LGLIERGAITSILYAPPPLRSYLRNAERRLSLAPGPHAREEHQAADRCAVVDLVSGGSDHHEILAWAP
jgi:hypothetical protein